MLPVLVALLASTAFAQTASLAVTGARVWTGNPNQPWAQALAAGSDGKLIAAGTDAAIAKLIGRSTVVLKATRVAHERGSPVRNSTRQPTRVR